jgi:hypothetical protein
LHRAATKTVRYTPLSCLLAFTVIGANFTKRSSPNTPAHAEQGSSIPHTLNKVARFARFYKLDSTLRISAASRQTKTSERATVNLKRETAAEKAPWRFSSVRRISICLGKLVPQVITVIATHTGYTTRFVDAEVTLVAGAQPPCSLALLSSTLLRPRPVHRLLYPVPHNHHHPCGTHAPLHSRRPPCRL